MVFIEILFKLGLWCLHEFHRNTSSFICNRFYTSGPQVYNNLYDKVSLCQWHSGTSGQTPGSIGALSTSIIMDTAWAHVGFVASNPYPIGLWKVEMNELSQSLTLKTQAILLPSRRYSCHALYRIILCCLLQSVPRRSHSQSVQTAVSSEWIQL